MVIMDERFMRKTEPGPGGCLLWIGTRTQDYKGYGVVRRNGRNYKAHRYVWEMHHGPIDAGLLICHTCDVPNCVAIEHLFLGTSRDNAVDMVRKGRAFKGTPRSGLKLSVDDVVSIRQRWVAGERQSDLAREFNVGPSHVSRIIASERRTWVACPTCKRPM